MADNNQEEKDNQQSKTQVAKCSCPFCRSERLYISMAEKGNGFWVRCGVCIAEGPFATTPDEAKYLWDNRAK